MYKVKKQQEDPVFIIVDLFCGAGGTSTGFAQATNDTGMGIAKVIACVNHDPIAIKSHWANHPEVKHFEEDIRTLDLAELIGVANFYRVLHPNAKLILWASLECTNFSKAKGGQPRDPDSRTLADHLDRYIIALNPDYIQIENVVEFMSWGPLDDKGKPVSRKKGADWMKWRERIKTYGYTDEWRELNAANYGAYTSRNRLFGIFSKPQLHVAFPEATHTKAPTKIASMYGETDDLQKWKAVKEVLDFEDEGVSIFDRKIPLVDATLERIYAGLIKFIAKGDPAFKSKYGMGKEPKEGSTKFLLQTYAANSKGHNTFGVDQPARTITTRDSTHLINPEFLAAYYGSGDNVSSVLSPAPVVTTKDRLALIQPQYFLDRQFGKSTTQSIDVPAGSVLPKDKHNLVRVEGGEGQYSYILNPSHGGHTTSTDAPCPVIVARQDKAPLYFVQVDKGAVSIPVYDTDSEIMIKIKQFMVAYNLVDIKMRMLRILELLRIQGFPVTYKLEGKQSDQKKFIGNSVVPHVVKAWVEALAPKKPASLSLAV